MLFLKRASDIFEQRYQEIIKENIAKGHGEEEAKQRVESPSRYKETFFIPEKARWNYIRDELHRDVANGLNKALATLEDSNPALEGVLGHIDFNRQVGSNRMSDSKLRDLIQHFSKYRLRNDDFVFPDLLRAAYEYLIAEFADSAGKKGGEFYTPRDMVQLMVRLVKPEKVLFINADGEYYAGRAQNYLKPEHIEKIISTFTEFKSITGYATVVSKEELAQNDYNCNIRRYADNAPPPENHDVTAHILGGIPKTEVEAQLSLLQAHGFNPIEILVPRK